MFPDHLRFDMRRIDAQMLAEVYAETLAVEISARAQYGRVAGDLTGDVGQRVRRVGYYHQNGLRDRLHNLWNDLPVNVGIVPQQPETPLRITAVCRFACFLIHAASD